MSHSGTLQLLSLGIQDVPINYLMGTSQSHDLGHCECPDHFLGWEIAWKLAGKILNVLEMYRVGKYWVHCPFPCDVLAMYWLSTPPLAPSVLNSRSLSTIFDDLQQTFDSFNDPRYLR